MLLYLSSKKFGNDIKILKDWINKHDNKIVIIPNALDAKSKEKIQENLKEDIELLANIGFNVKIIDLKNYFSKYNEPFLITLSALAKSALISGVISS